MLAELRRRLGNASADSNRAQEQPGTDGRDMRNRVKCPNASTSQPSH